MMARVAQRLAFTDLRQDEAAFLSWLTPVLETPPAVAFVRKIPSPTILAGECQ